MRRNGQPAFLHSLRFKLLIASLTLLVIPWVGYRYLLETEDALRQAQETLLLSRAEVVAKLLAGKLAERDVNPLLPPGDPSAADTLYVHPLAQAAVADGYAEEWADLLSQARRYRASETSSNTFGFELLAGYYAQYLYLLVRVSDATPTYPKADGTLTSGDHLILALPGEGRNSHQYLLGTPAPGWISVQRMDSRQQVSAIRGEWQETAEGYDVELRIPLSMTHGYLSLAAINLDRIDGRPVGIASTSGWQRNDNLARLIMPSLPSAKLLQGLDSNTHRYTILNRRRQVIGRHGSLMPRQQPSSPLTGRLLSLLLTQDGVAEYADREHAGRMDGPEIRQALSGHGAVYRYRPRGSGRLILSAAYPLFNGGKVSAVILVEQTTEAILLLQQKAFERLLSVTLLLFLITGGSLFLLASYLTRRISRLNRKFTRAVSHDGRVIESVNGATEGDELGALDRSFTTVLQRLQAYNSYLEGMASRLAHEFRTPLAIVQSSLENLQAGDDGETRQRYAERALEGTRRLHLILNRLREATRLEQAMQSAEMTVIEMTGLCHALCESYQVSHPSLRFDCTLPEQPLRSRVAPDLISQAMDKLVGNAVDFHTPQSPIQISLEQHEGDLVIRVANQGPPLPEVMQASLFQSMVSLRERRDDEPHLGLGLYLVKLIMEFHRGRASGENIEGGVCFRLELPILPEDGAEAN
jgi:two-component system, OmpR family, sensor histidine kinase ChvG